MGARGAWGPGARRGRPRSERECRVVAGGRPSRGERRGCGRQVERAEHACGGLPLGHDRDRAQRSSAARADQLGCEHGCEKLDPEQIAPPRCLEPTGRRGRSRSGSAEAEGSQSPRASPREPTRPARRRPRPAPRSPGAAARPEPGPRDTAPDSHAVGARDRSASLVSPPRERPHAWCHPATSA
jgi:hypothetical protein